ETPEESALPLDGAPEEPDDTPDSTAEDFTACYYQNRESSLTNHEVIIVGWDDNYPAENFGYSDAGLVPPGNGAWLCRNSYGTSWGDGGYFWVSYYDASVSANTNGSISARVTVFDFGPADNYDNNYEYDGAAILGYVNDRIDGRGVSTTSASSSTRRWYANIFTANGNGAARGTELLKAVSTYSYRAGVPYTVEVYTNLKNTESPLSGTLAATVSGTFPYAGFHTVELPEAVTLEEGEMFSVVFRVAMATDSSVFVPGCSTSSTWYSTNDSAAGQSFVSLDGDAWIDCHSLTGAPNVRIKAYTDSADAVFPFTDVPETAWYYQDVEAAWLKLLVNGMSDTAYEPAGTATRAQVVTTLWRLAGEPAPSNASAFSDVKTGLWYSDAIAWASESGIVNGYTTGKFCPANPITRQELMTILYRFAAFNGMDTSQTASLTGFKDYASVASWAEEAVIWSVASGLQNGVAKSSGVYLDPTGYVTRAQLAAFLNRFSEMNE
ncbi:MAG: lectin like domain-containing protein, partial [Oscillospiraceae bacterium]